MARGGRALARAPHPSLGVYLQADYVGPLRKAAVADSMASKATRLERREGFGAPLSAAQIRMIFTDMESLQELHEVSIWGDAREGGRERDTETQRHRNRDTERHRETQRARDETGEN